MVKQLYLSHHRRQGQNQVNVVTGDQEEITERKFVSQEGLKIECFEPTAGYAIAEGI